MNVVGVIILLAVAVPLIAFLVWQFLTEARVQIEAGNIGLLIARGKVKDRALMPGVHYVWPFRRQMIQEYTLRELSYVAGDEPSDDVAVSAHLGDKTKVDVSYTVRYKVDPDGLRTVHERVGPDGVVALVRDESRHAVISVLGDEAIGLDDSFGARFAALEQAITERLRSRLGEAGLDLTMFSLRELDLAETGEMIQDALRVGVEIEREKARATVRRARIEHESEDAVRLSGSLTDTIVRYRQVEAWREYVARWDGRGQLPLPPTGVIDVPPPRPVPESENAGDEPAPAPAPGEGEVPLT